MSLRKKLTYAQASAIAQLAISFTAATVGVSSSMLRLSFSLTKFSIIEAVS